MARLLRQDVHAVLAGRDRPARDARARGGVEAQDGSGPGEVEAVVRAPERAQVGRGREAPRRARQGVAPVELVGDPRAAAGPALAEQLGEAGLGGLAGRGDPARQLGLGAFEIPPQHDVDDPADGVRAVEGRGAVEQDLHPRNRDRRDRRDVGEVALGAGAGHAPPVDQGQGGVAAEAAQVQARTVVDVGGGPVRVAGDRALVAGPGEVLRQDGERAGHGRVAGACEVRLVDDQERRGQRRGAADVRAGDLDRLERRRLVAGGVGRARIADRRRDAGAGRPALSAERARGLRGRRPVRSRRRRAVRARLEHDHLWPRARRHDVAGGQEAGERPVGAEPAGQGRHAPAGHQFGREDQLLSGLGRQRRKRALERSCRQIELMFAGRLRRGRREEGAHRQGSEQGRPKAPPETMKLPHAHFPRTVAGEPAGWAGLSDVAIRQARKT